MISALYVKADFQVGWYCLVFYGTSAEMVDKLGEVS